MVELDIQALNDRLFDNMDGEAIQLLVENQSDQDIRDTDVWTRWVINPSTEVRRTLGHNPTYLQEGTATLQIFVPAGQLTGPGDDIRTQFNNLFRDWRSDDRRLEVYGLKSTSSAYERQGSKYHLINAMALWRSKRRVSEPEVETSSGGLDFSDPNNSGNLVFF